MVQGEITLLLAKARNGSLEARNEVFSRLYGELQKLARAKLMQEQTLTPLDACGLVHEVYVRLIRQPELPAGNRRAFFAYAAKAMRSVIVDYARERNAAKRGGGLLEVTLTDVAEAGAEESEATHDVVELDSALQLLERIDGRCHQVVELKYFVGLSVDDIADTMEISPKTVKRDLQKARAFLSETLLPSAASKPM